MCDFKTWDRINEKPNVWLMCGLPRTGKSTWARENCDKLKATIVSCDDIRRALGVQFDKNLEDVVWFVFKYMVKSLLKRGQNIIVDNCNNTVDERSMFVDMDYNDEIVLFFVMFPDLPIEEWKDRCEKTNFPWEVVESMKEKREGVVGREYNGPTISFEV